MLPCPPAPDYMRSLGVSDCEYQQLTPFQKKKFYDQNVDSLQYSNLLKNNSNGYYKIGEYNMLGNSPCYACGSTAIRKNPLGRSVLNIRTAADWNQNHAVSADVFSPYSSLRDSQFINDLWTAQVLAYWLSDGNNYSDYGQAGKVTAKGFNPSDISPLGLNLTTGHVTTDLRDLLNPTNNRDENFVKGPDGRFGPSAESIIVEWAGSRKLFGRSVPANAQAALNRLMQGISTVSIDNAIAAFDAGNPISNDAPASTPCSMLSPEAKAARADCGGTGGGNRGGNDNDNKNVASGDSNTMLWVLLAAGVIGGGYWYYTNMNKSNNL